jgi:hypothetical protein
VHAAETGDERSAIGKIDKVATTSDFVTFVPMMFMGEP